MMHKVHCLFSDALLGILRLISFFVQDLSTVCTKIWAKLDMRVCFFLYFKSEFKKFRARVFSSQTLLAEEKKNVSGKFLILAGVDLFQFSLNEQVR